MTSISLVSAQFSMEFTGCTKGVLIYEDALHVMEESGLHADDGTARGLGPTMAPAALRLESFLSSPPSNIRLLSLIQCSLTMRRAAWRGPGGRRVMRELRAGAGRPRDHTAAPICGRACAKQSHGAPPSQSDSQQTISDLCVGCWRTQSCPVSAVENRAGAGGDSLLCVLLHRRESTD